MAHDGALTEAVAKLSLRDKVRLLTGATAWSLHPIEAIGLRPVVVSDGPVGVRGTRDDPADWSLLFPAPSALAATWDVRAARDLGDLFAAEAHRKGVDVILAPVVNLQRTPVGGRHFECFSEDPVLTGTIATALIGAIQGHGIGVCLKHLVANDSETERTSYVARMDERTLREVYLAPFEQAVREASPWSIMAAYNGIDTGVEAAPATENHHLLVDILKGEWGYDGAVISDWLATTSTVASALGGLDLVMPGPGGPWEDMLAAEVRAGAVPESVIDDKVTRVLRLAARVGAWSPDAAERVPAAPRRAPEGVTATETLTRLAAQATVLLTNTLPDGAALLPVNPRSVRSVALIGPGAVEPFVQGGGSAHVHPRGIVLPEHGLRALLPDDVTISVHRGGITARLAPALDLAARATDPVTGTPGLRIDVLDAAGALLDTWTECEKWDGRPDLGDRYPSADHLRLRANVLLTEPGVHRIGIGTVGEYSIRVDGRVTDTGDHRVGAEVILDSSVNDPEETPAVIEVTTPHLAEIDATVQVIDAKAYGRFARAAIRHARPGSTTDEEIAEAVEAARTADLAIVVVGTNLESESEGWDRTTLALPGRQDELVRRVSAANPRTVVFVNAGAPVILPWLDASPVDHEEPSERTSRPAATLWWWLPGQEAGHALAGTVFGRYEPAGRLPWTLPAREEDVPVPDAIPVAGDLDYTEGVDVGYRSWDALGRVPARPFGFGLGWGDWTYGPLEITDRSDAGVTVHIDLHNAAPRTSSEVVQIYVDALSHDDSRCAGGTCDERCLTRVGERRLGGHAVVTAAAASDVSATILVPRRALESWDVGSHRWAPAGTHIRLHAARNVRDSRADTILYPADLSAPPDPRTASARPLVTASPAPHGKEAHDPYSM